MSSPNLQFFFGLAQQQRYWLSPRLIFASAVNAMPNPKITILVSNWIFQIVWIVMTVRTSAGPEMAQNAGIGRRTRAAAPPQTRSEAEFASARRHSRRVRLLKFGLPLAALFAMGFFAAATFLADSNTPTPSMQSVSMSDGRVVMAKPKLEGFDADKRPYVMTAERAIQQSASSSIIELEKIVADLPFGKSETAKLTANGGVFDNASNKLDLKDNIRLFTSGGMKAVLSQASINLSTNDMVSDAPVDIVTDVSRITADRMRIEGSGKVFVFESRVRLKIDANKMKQASDAAAEPGTQ
jgi:lipopolysaccharide export system protein LptC